MPEGPSIQSPPEIFARMVKNHAFDFAEMSISMHLTLRAKGEFPFVALPIFPSKVFRHGFIFINNNSGIRTPKDLEGKRVGVPEYRQTAAIWIRGILHSEYGVDLGSIQWIEGGANTPREPDVLDLRPAEPIDIHFAHGKTLSDMLANGEIDAMIGARQPFSLGKSPDVTRLFPKFREVEREYYKKTGIFPIMHTLVVDEELYRHHPWVAESMYKAFEQAKHWTLEQMRFSGTMRYTLPWLFADIVEFEGDVRARSLVVRPGAEPKDPRGAGPVPRGSAVPGQARSAGGNVPAHRYHQRVIRRPRRKANHGQPKEISIEETAPSGGIP